MPLLDDSRLLEALTLWILGASLKAWGSRDCPGFKEPDSKLEKPSCEPEPESEQWCSSLIWDGPLCMGERASVSLTHVRVWGHRTWWRHFSSTSIESSFWEPRASLFLQHPPTSLHFRSVCEVLSFSNWDLPSCSAWRRPSPIQQWKGARFPGAAQVSAAHYSITWALLMAVCHVM